MLYSIRQWAAYMTTRCALSCCNVFIRFIRCRIQPAIRRCIQPTMAVDKWWDRAEKRRGEVERGGDGKQRARLSERAIAKALTVTATLTQLNLCLIFSRGGEGGR